MSVSGDMNEIVNDEFAKLKNSSQSNGYMQQMTSNLMSRVKILSKIYAWNQNWIFALGNSNVDACFNIKTAPFFIFWMYQCT